MDLAALSHRRAVLVVPQGAALARTSGLDGDALERELVLVEVGDANDVWEPYYGPVLLAQVTLKNKELKLARAR
ncbi:hypothetical protein [Sorangium sp. So ce362]|uniref:hypothetical protein n=1 Tax=Sorangium sp. So ce362 TaxID=3133303 RepID=UPI003F6403FE